MILLLNNSYSDNAVDCFEAFDYGVVDGLDIEHCVSVIFSRLVIELFNVNVGGGNDARNLCQHIRDIVVYDAYADSG